MPQVKKKEMRDAILQASRSLFVARGYAASSLLAISRASGTTVANVYVYFPSKLALFVAVFEPWLTTQLDDLEIALSLHEKREDRLRQFLTTLWRDIPCSHQGLAGAFVEAMTAMHPEERMMTSFASLNQRLTALLLTALPADRAFLVADGLVAKMIWSTFEGFALDAPILQAEDFCRLLDHMITMLLGSPPPEDGNRRLNDHSPDTTPYYACPV